VRFGDDRGLIGKLIVIWLLMFALAVVGAIDAGSIVLARFRGNDVATRAAVAAASTLAVEGDRNRAEESAQETVDGQTGATMTDFAIAADGSVTVDVRMDPNTIVAERLDFLLGDLVVVTAEATAPPPTA